jgi:predicted amidophosphoribosyltransferase
VICPACAYEFEPTGGFACPRCGETLSCSKLSCGECNACAGVFERLRHSVVDRFSGDDTGGTDEDRHG